MKKIHSLGGEFMKRNSKLVYRVILLVIILGLLVGCSSKNMGKGDMALDEQVVPAETGAWDNGFTGSVDSDLGGNLDEDVMTEETNVDGVAGPIKDENILHDSNDKIIRKINLGLETQVFDELVNSIETQVNELGGYIETSRITGRHYNSDNLRYGTIVARIPKETVDGFVRNLGNIANIVEKAENVENVTLQYVDIESRIKALEIEQERLLDLLERAKDIEVIISLESRLTSVRYELQSLNTKIRTIDNLVDYSTVTMEIQEVRLMSASIDEEESLGDRIARGTRETFYNFKEAFEDFLVWFIVSLPYIIFWGIIILVIVLIIRKIIKKFWYNNNFKYIGSGKEPSQEVKKEDSNISNKKE